MKDADAAIGSTTATSFNFPDNLTDGTHFLLYGRHGSIIRSSSTSSMCYSSTAVVYHVWTFDVSCWRIIPAGFVGPTLFDRPNMYSVEEVVHLWAVTNAFALPHTASAAAVASHDTACFFSRS